MVQRNGDKVMINVVYSKNGNVVSDANLEAWAKQTIKDHKKFGTIDVTVGTSIMVDMLRALIVRKKVHYSEINFFNSKKGIPITTNEFGRLSSWPKGFCDKEEALLFELLTAGTEERKKKKEKDISDHLY